MGARGERSVLRSVREPAQTLLADTRRETREVAGTRCVRCAERGCRRGEFLRFATRWNVQSAPARDEHALVDCVTLCVRLQTERSSRLVIRYFDTRLRLSIV